MSLRVRKERRPRKNAALTGFRRGVSAVGRSVGLCSGRAWRLAVDCQASDLVAVVLGASSLPASSCPDPVDFGRPRCAPLVRETG